MIDILYKTLKQRGLSEIKDYKAGSWIDVSNATNESLIEAAALCELNVEDIQDALDIQEVPRIEKINGKTVMFLKTPAPLEETAYTQSLTIIITDKYLVTISPQENEVVKQVRSKELNVATTQSAKLIIHILINIALTFTGNVEMVRKQLREQKVHITQVRNDDILKLVENEEVLNYYLAALIPMRNVFEKILSGKYFPMYAEDEGLFQDMLDSVNQSVDVCTVNIKSIAALRDSYQVILNNNLNQTMKFLASITIILTIPTIISSIYGMNVGLPLDHHPMAFWILMGGAGVISLVAWIVFYFKKWL